MASLAVPGGNTSTTSGDCPPGYWGKNCDQPCPPNCLDGVCLAFGFCKECISGYAGFRCEEECKQGYFGPGCKKICSFHCDTLKCHPVTGACNCKTAGWKSEQCTEACDRTTWGHHCTERCSTGCEQQNCDPELGHCKQGCTSGFLGDFCNQPCMQGMFGQNCTESCSTQCTNAKCDHIDGHCLNCPQGFNGNLCEIPCEAGHWGSRCTNPCGKNCRGPDQDCKATDGTCTAGCTEGWKGALCNEVCSPGTYGSNCSKTCGQNCLSPKADNSLCDHVTGYCPQGCKGGYSGAACLTQMTTMTTSAAATGGIAAAVALAVILGVLLLIFFVCRRRRRSPKSVSQIREDNNSVHLDSAYGFDNKAYDKDKKDNGGLMDEDEASDRGISMATGPQKPIYYNTSAGLSSTRMASRDLPSLLEKWRGDKTTLIEQFQKLPQGLISTTSVALNMTNKPKNRYKNICAYDHSRVKLSIIDSDPNSDYINASIVEGYDSRPKFIASQGPNAVILNDFLRMLWEKRVTTVLMLTNLHEGGKHKCEQYWPDSGEKKYGTVTVTLLSTRRTAHYVIRTLQLAKGGHKLQVTQHHFTSWPDKGVPFSAWPLLDFHMMVTTHVATQPQDSPIVVHCSAGIGRTGTYIALHNLLCETAATLALDFYSCVWKLRQARVNMIQTVDQYYFLHEAVMAGIAVAGTLHNKNELTDALDDLNKPTAEGFTKMAAEFKRLGTCHWKIDEDDAQAGRREENISKNRYFNILPRDSHRPILGSLVLGTNDYINAVLLPGYRSHQRFLVTQMPLASTVLDFWRLVGEYPVSTIVIFPATPTSVGDTAPQFWPDEDQTSQFGPYKVTGRSYSQHDHYKEAFVYLSKTRKLPIGRKGRGLQLLQCEETSPSPKLMLSLAQHAIFGVPDKQMEESMILVVCRTGAELSGVFAAVAQIIERLAEAPVSVPAVVGGLRAIRPQLVSTLEQYQSIYEAAKLFATTPSMSSIVISTQPLKPARKLTRAERRNEVEEEKDNGDQTHSTAKHRMDTDSANMPASRTSTHTNGTGLDTNGPGPNTNRTGLNTKSTGGQVLAQEVSDVGSDKVNVTITGDKKGRVNFKL